MEILKIICYPYKYYVNSLSKLIFKAKNVICTDIVRANHLEVTNVFSTSFFFLEIIF